LQKKVKEYLSRISDDNSEIQKLQEEITINKREYDMQDNENIHSNLITKSNPNLFSDSFPYQSLLNLKDGNSMNMKDYKDIIIKDKDAN